MGLYTAWYGRRQLPGLYSARLRNVALRFERLCAEASDAESCRVAEHVFVANELIGARLSSLVRSERVPDVFDDEVPFLFYRAQGQARCAAASGSWNSWSEHAAAFRASVQRIEQWAIEAEPDLRFCGAEHPAFGWLDGAQWLLFACAHIERHRSQLLGLLRRNSAA